MNAPLPHQVLPAHERQPLPEVMLAALRERPTA